MKYTPQEQAELLKLMYPLFDQYNSEIGLELSVYLADELGYPKDEMLKYIIGFFDKQKAKRDE